MCIRDSVKPGEIGRSRHGGGRRLCHDARLVLVSHDSPPTVDRTMSETPGRARMVRVLEQRYEDDHHDAAPDDREAEEVQ